MITSQEIVGGIKQHCSNCALKDFLLLIDPDAKTSLDSLQSYWMRTITDRVLESAFIMSLPGDFCTQQSLRLTGMKELQSPDLILHEDYFSRVC